MIPIQELLSRIRWDEEFGQGTFRLGYYDRVEDRIMYVDFEELFFEPGDHFTFELVDIDGVVHHVPLHRIREVYRNGDLIWHRQG